MPTARLMIHPYPQSAIHHPRSPQSAVRSPQPTAHSPQFTGHSSQTAKRRTKLHILFLLHVSGAVISSMVSHMSTHYIESSPVILYIILTCRSFILNAYIFFANFLRKLNLNALYFLI